MAGSKDSWIDQEIGMRLSPRLGSLVLGIAAFVAPGAAIADAIHYRLEGTIDESRNDFDPSAYSFDKYFSVGAPLRIDLSIDPDRLVAGPSPDSRVFDGDGTPAGVHLGVGVPGLGSSTDSQDETHLIVIHGEPSGSGGTDDRLEATFTYRGSGVDREVLTVRLVDHQATALPGGVLPATLDPVRFDDATFSWEGFLHPGDTEPVYRYAGQIEAIPEPTSWALWMALAAAGSWLGRRRAKAA